ncbi:MAG: hypothetical protein ABR607_17590, partial [Pyrinomonadaceae bacterium]
AVEIAALDPVAAVRRRAAALSVSEGFADLASRLAEDADASVRAAIEAATREAPLPTKPPARDIAAEAVLAVQSAIFGLSEAELAERRAALQKRGGYQFPKSQTPWQEIQRSMVDQLADGMVLKPAVKYQRVAQKSVPRDNH